MRTEAAATLNQADPDLYSRDFSRWSEEQGSALEHRDVSALDWENLAEEIKALSRSDKRALLSHLVNLLKHLIKYELQPEKRSASWQISINSARREIHSLLSDSPSLNRHLTDGFQAAYRDAYEDALIEMERNDQPKFTRMTVEQALDHDFLPGKRT